MIETDKTPTAVKNQAEIDRIMTDMENDPNDYGFAKMFAHCSAPLRVVLVDSLIPVSQEEYEEEE